MQQPARKNLADILNPSAKRGTPVANSTRSFNTSQVRGIAPKMQHSSDQLLLKDKSSDGSLSPKTKFIRLLNNHHRTESQFKYTSDNGERQTTLNSVTYESGQALNTTADVKTPKNSTQKRFFQRANTNVKLKQLRDENLRPLVHLRKGFLTPKHESPNSNRTPKASEKTMLASNISLTSTEQGILPKLGVQETKEKQNFTPKHSESPSDVSNRFSYQTPESKSSRSLSKELVKNRFSEPVQTVRVAQDNTPKKSSNDSFQVGPMARVGKTIKIKTGKNDELELTIEKSQSDNCDDKTLNFLKKPVKKNPLNFRHLIFSPNIDKEVFKKHLLLVHSGLIYSTQFLRGPSEKFLESKQISLGDPVPSYRSRSTNLKTLVLDLDETLIKSCPGATDYDKMALAKKDGQVFQIPFKIRPYAQQFISQLKSYYEIIVFTASMKHYAEAIIEILDPEAHITYILDRTYCLETKNGYAIKDLRIIKNRDLKNMVIVDNLVHSFGLQLENGIPILEWNGEREDTELKHMVDYLIQASYADDLREYNKENLRLRELAASSLPHIMLNI